MKAIFFCKLISLSSLCCFIFSGTWFGRVAAFVPGSGEKAKAPSASNSKFRTNSMSSLNSLSVSPGNPTIIVVLMAIFGIFARSFSSRRSIDFLSVFLVISFRILSFMCWSGISTYLTSLSRFAIASIVASEKFAGYVYINRIQSSPFSLFRFFSNLAKPSFRLMS